MTSRVPTVWLTFSEVCSHVRKSENIVRARMQDTQRDECPVEKCWTNAGTADYSQITFRSLAEVDRWWHEINVHVASPDKPARRVALRASGVYVVRQVGGSFWKIGLAANLTRRVQHVMRTVPFETAVHLIVRDPSPAELERALLAAWARWRTRGEWFSIPAADEADALAALRSTIGSRPTSEVLP